MVRISLFESAPHAASSHPNVLAYLVFSRGGAQTDARFFRPEMSMRKNEDGSRSCDGGSAVVRPAYCDASRKREVAARRLLFCSQLQCSVAHGALPTGGAQGCPRMSLLCAKWSGFRTQSMNGSGKPFIEQSRSARVTGGLATTLSYLDDDGNEIAKNQCGW